MRFYLRLKKTPLSRRRRTFEKSGRGTVLGFLPVRGCIEVVVYHEAPWGNGWGCFAHRILPRFDLCHPTRQIDMLPSPSIASKTPKWVRSGAVAGDGQHCSRHEVDPGRGSGSLREASVGSSSVPLVCSLPFGAPMPRRHGSSMINYLESSKQISVA